MGPVRRPANRSRFDEEKQDSAEGIARGEPEGAEQDWESLEGAAPDTEIMPGDGDEGDGIESAVQSGTEADGDLAEEDDDNPDQESDEAMPDDDEEQAIRNDMGGSGIRYKPE